MQVMLFRKKRTYLDYAAATPVDPEILDLFFKTQKSSFANPGGLHGEGVVAKNLLEQARADIAKTLHAEPNEIIFVSGGTESDNLALLGIIEGIPVGQFPLGVLPHVLISAIEHSALFETVQMLAKRGRLVYDLISVDHNGLVDPEAIPTLIRPETVFISVMYVNNEIGSVQPIREIAKQIRHFKKQQEQKSQYPVVHVDAAQAANYFSLTIPSLGVDLLSFTASKIYAPRGIAVLYRKRGTPLAPVFGGGDQELGLRPGTESVALAVACAAAFAKAQKNVESEFVRAAALRDYCSTVLGESIPDIFIYGDMKNVAPHILNFHIPNVSAETVVLYLDAEGFAVSSKSACKSTDPEQSHVIAALNIADIPVEEGSVRVSFGKETTKSDVVNFVKALAKVLPAARGEFS